MSGALSASLEATLAVEMFLNENYRFRRNTLNGKVARIQQLNQEFMEQKDLGEMFVACFRQPEEGEVAKQMNCEQMIEEIRKSYPSLPNTIGNKVRLGRTIKALGFKHKERAHISYYDVMPIKVA